MNIIEKAVRFARQKHFAQLDDSGRDYFTAHLAPVGELIKLVTDDVNVLCAGYLHDTLEDTETTYAELVENFGVDIAKLVREVSHEGCKDSKGYYFPYLKTNRAYLIKFADRLSNLSRMNGGKWEDEKVRAHYMRKSVFWKTE